MIDDAPVRTDLVVTGQEDADTGQRFVLDLRDQSALDMLPVGVLLADETGAVVAVNQSWVDLSGLDRSQSTGGGWLQTLDPTDRDVVLDQVRSAAGERATSVAEFQLDLDTGRRWTRWWVRASDHPPGGTAPHLPVAIAVADSHSEHAFQEELRHRATHDSLTGLVQRRHLFELVEHVLRSHERHPSHLAVLYVDLDEFKRINDDHGHATGDRVLTTVAQRLRSAVRPDDVVARVGGDEFAVMCDHLEDVEDVEAIIERIRAALERPLDAGKEVVRLGASVGTAFANGHSDSPEKILDRADRAMYLAKRAVHSGTAATGRGGAPGLSPPRAGSTM
jgi:diguanylate cyclase (GGDEF)-like protein